MNVHLTPKTPKLLKQLSGPPLPEELVSGDAPHSPIGSHQPVINRNDLGAISGPGESGGNHGNLLETGDSLHWGLEISDVCGGDEPLDTSAVEEN